MTEEGKCVVCGADITLEYCCSGKDCGCMGLPINPPLCSDECYDIAFNEPDKYFNRSGVSVESTKFNPDESKPISQIK